MATWLLPLDDRAMRTETATRRRGLARSVRARLAGTPARTRRGRHRGLTAALPAAPAC
jgi:hypothetical protein